MYFNFNFSCNWTVRNKGCGSSARHPSWNIALVMVLDKISNTDPWFITSFVILAWKAYLRNGSRSPNVYDCRVTCLHVGDIIAGIYLLKIRFEDMNIMPPTKKMSTEQNSHRLQGVREYPSFQPMHCTLKFCQVLEQPVTQWPNRHFFLPNDAHTVCAAIATTTLSLQTTLQVLSQILQQPFLWSISTPLLQLNLRSGFKNKSNYLDQSQINSLESWWL